MAYVNVQLTHIWTIGMTGRIGTLSATLSRFPDTDTKISASESVTIGEVGTTGSYWASYTPTLAQPYSLKLEDSALYTSKYWDDDVYDPATIPSPPAPGGGPGYCSQADDESYAQLGGFGSGTIPSDTDVALFIYCRAGELLTALYDVAPSSAALAPDGWTNPIDQSTDSGTALAAALREANAIGAAADALQASGATDSPSRTERVLELLQWYQSAMENILRGVIGYLDDTGQLAAAKYSATAYSTGEITKKAKPSHEEPGLRVNDWTRW